MENILGHASNLSHSSGLISTTAKRSLGQRSSKLTTTPWICQRCYNHSQSNLRKAGNAYPLASRPRSIRQRDLSQLFFSTSQSLKHADEAKFEKRAARDDLPSHEESRRSHLSKKFSHVMDHLQSNIFTAGQRLNDLTGYSGIEALKKEIEEQEKLVQSTRSDLQKVREDYSKAISQRSGSQREVNELLQRKHAWTPNDLERFTALYRSDHANEQAEIAAQEKLAVAERQTEEAGAKLSACILARYHEEQIWSDKIRRMSTWGTWGLMGVNILLFLVFQIGVEPWRRRRLVKGFEDKVMEAFEREGSAGATLAELSKAKDVSNVPTEPVEDVERTTNHEILPEPQVSVNVEMPPEYKEETWVSPDSLQPLTLPSSTLGRIKGSITDMFSERQITIRRIDLTTAMLEGTAAGIAFVGLVVLFLRPR